MRTLGVVLLLAFACSVNAVSECNVVKAENIIQPDSRFSLNSCIVIGEFNDPDCTRATPLIESNEECPSVGENSTQIIYKSIEEAVRCCPFDPVLIETVGVIYIKERIVYSQPRDIIVRGTSIGNFHSILVNAHKIEIKHTNINVQFSSLTFEGCSIFDSLFASPMQNLEHCLIDQSLSFDGCVIQNYFSPIVVCQITTETSTSFWLTNSVISDVPFTALMVVDSPDCNILRNAFFNCGNADFSCFEVINANKLLLIEGNEYFSSNESD